MTTKPKTDAARPTLTERLDGLTGRDELAILDAFGHDVWDTYDAITATDVDAGERVSQKLSGRLGRMLVFVDKLRDGLPPAVAANEVLDMTATDVNTLLALDEADTEEAGKGESSAD